MDGMVCGYHRIHNGANVKSFDSFELGARKMVERRFSSRPLGSSTRWYPPANHNLFSVSILERNPDHTPQNFPLHFPQISSTNPAHS